MKRLPFVFVAVVSLGLGDMSQARAGPETTPGVTGQWRGLHRSTDQGAIHAFTLAITSQVERRFQGTLAIGDHTYALDGTISASGNVNIVGRGQDGILVLHSKLHDLGGGAAILDGRSRFNFNEGDQDDGLVLILRNYTPVPGSPPPSVAGAWSGASISDATGQTSKMSATFTHGPAQDVPGAPRSTGFCGDLSLVDMNYTGCGTINGKGEFVVIAMGVDGPVLLQGGYTPARTDGTAVIPARLCGNYRVDLIDMNFRDTGEFCIIDMN